VKFGATGLLMLTAMAAGQIGRAESGPQRDKVDPPIPSEFVLGRHTFFDVGPPFDFYEVLLVRSVEQRTLVERLLVTPPGDPCTQPATVELASTILSEPIEELLGGRNPCMIPEKALRKELKRCKRCLVFSGAAVTMAVQCGGNRRLIHSDILDRDMFDQRPNTPEYTSRTMSLLSRLDKGIGPGVLDKPMFALDTPGGSPPDTIQPDYALALSRGDFDELFQGAPHKVSQLYAAAKIRPTSPSVRLISILPISPISPPLLKYPPLAWAARISGKVAFTLDIGAQGEASNIRIVEGHPLLRAAVRDELATWRFPLASVGQPLHGEIEFKTNCTGQ